MVSEFTSRARPVGLFNVLEMLTGVDVEDRIKQAAKTIYALIEAELTSVIGAPPHEPSDARTAQRNGHRSNTITTTTSDLQLQISTLRIDSFFPSLAERRRRAARHTHESLSAPHFDHRRRRPRPGPPRRREG